MTNSPLRRRVVVAVASVVGLSMLAVADTHGQSAFSGSDIEISRGVVRVGDLVVGNGRITKGGVDLVPAQPDWPFEPTDPNPFEVATPVPPVPPEPPSMDPNVQSFDLCMADPAVERAIEQFIAGRGFSASLTSNTNACARLVVRVMPGALAGQSTTSLSVSGSDSTGTPHRTNVRIVVSNGATHVSLDSSP